MDTILKEFKFTPLRIIGYLVTMSFAIYLVIEVCQANIGIGVWEVVVQSGLAYLLIINGILLGIILAMSEFLLFFWKHSDVIPTPMVIGWL